MNYQLIVLDVDGTLLDSDHVLRPRAAAAVRAIRASGVHVALATGKLLASVRALLAETGISGPQIVLNGAAILDSETDVTIRFAPLAEDARRRIIELVRELGPDVLVSHFARDTIYMDREHPRIGIFAEYGECPPILVPDLLAPGLPPAAKILLSDAPERLAVLRGRIAPLVPSGVVTTTTTPDFLEFFDAFAGKGAALATLRERLGIPKMAVLAMGDGENDIPLFKEAGTAVAMGNAGPLAKAAADRIAPTNDEEGVAVVLEELLEGAISG